MSSRKVLDSYAILAYFESEPGADKVAELIKQARDKDDPLLISAINWGEVYYIIARTAGKNAAEEALRIIDTFPIEIIPADRDLTRRAAEIKSTHKLSFTDCFAAALAKEKKADLVTGDPEFECIAHAVKISWIK